MKDPSSIPDVVAKAGLTLPLGELFAPFSYDRLFQRKVIK
jgi:hypothetical protein